MQVMFRPFGLFLIIFASFTSVNAAPRPLENALDAVQQQNWQAALQLAAQDGRIATDIIEWHLHRSGAGTAQAVSRFMDRNSDWPGLPYLQKQSEQAFLDAPTDVVLNFFQRHAPVTAVGGFAHAAALLAEGKTEQARQVVQDFWVSAPMSYKVQQAYLDQFSDQLSRLHDARLAEMLWQDAHASAEAILPYVSSKQAAMAKARIALRKGEQGVDPLIAAVADELQESPLLAHARFTWRLRAGRQDAALALLIERSQSADLLGRPEVWSKGRKLLVRELISERRFDVAYQLASSHHLTKGSDFADLEWLAGYIALRHHNSPTIAQVHFENLLLMSETPISLSRGYYWLGVAHQVQGNEDTALRSFRLGADYQIAFYGLLCAEKIAAPVAGDLSNDVALPDWQDAAFRQSPVFQATILLYASDQPILAERFATHLAETLPEDQLPQLIDFLEEIKQPRALVRLGKRKASQGYVYPRPLFALHPLSQKTYPVATELMLAIARRETEFKKSAISPAGARGLMQVMPATAKAMAQKLGEGYSPDRLIRDWEYNAELAGQYLADLTQRFDGNPVLVAAAYNAGPNRVDSWIKKLGDPRAPEADIVEWIEMIPYVETRNYVMRVAESLTNYRARLGKPAAPQPFSAQLKRPMTQPLAPKGE